MKFKIVLGVLVGFALFAGMLCGPIVMYWFLGMTGTVGDLPRFVLAFVAYLAWHASIIVPLFGIIGAYLFAGLFLTREERERLKG